MGLALSLDYRRSFELGFRSLGNNIPIIISPETGVPFRDSKAFKEKTSKDDAFESF